MGHRAHFRDEKLVALFPPTLSCCFAKRCMKQHRGSGAWEFGETHLSLIVSSGPSGVWTNCWRPPNTCFRGMPEAVPGHGDLREC